MNKTKEVLAKGAIATGLIMGIGSCTVDVATCPGEVETGDRDVPKMLCDENPESDNFINSPGTTEQKLMYGGFAIAVVGGTALGAMKWREESDQVIRFDISTKSCF